MYLEAIKKGHVFSFLDLGNLYNEQKKYDKAEKAFLKSIEMGNIESPALNLGKIFLELKDYPNAKKYYKMGINNK